MSASFLPPSTENMKEINFLNIKDLSVGECANFVEQSLNIMLKEGKIFKEEESHPRDFNDLDPYEKRAIMIGWVSILKTGINYFENHCFIRGTVNQIEKITDVVKDILEVMETVKNMGNEEDE